MERTLEGSGAGERRRAARRLGTSLDWLRSAQIRSGHAVEVVEWSLWGALLDTGACLAPGRNVALQLECNDRRVVIRSLVLRSWVSALQAGGTIRYRSAIAFGEKACIGQVPKKSGGVAPHAASRSTAATVGTGRGGPRNSDRLLRWDPDHREGVWNVPKETELPG